jgi:hypothetical protein
VRFLGLVIDSGNHSLAGSRAGAAGVGVLELEVEVDFPAELEETSKPFFSASSLASISAEAFAISSGLTSSPLRMRAAISGVTRTRRTEV